LAIENRNQMNVIDEAIARGADESRSALGLEELWPDILIAAPRPKGVKTRAAVADIGSLKIHERRVPR
jgi:hypothetical protein